MKEQVKETRWDVSTKIYITFDGVDYKAHIKERMSGEGYIAWQERNRDKIYLAKVYCYTKHVQKFGQLNQTLPTVSEVKYYDEVEDDEQLEIEL